MNRRTITVKGKGNVQSNMLLEASVLPEIEPEAVEVGDTVRFVWEIK